MTMTKHRRLSESVKADTKHPIEFGQLGRAFRTRFNEMPLAEPLDEDIGGDVTSFRQEKRQLFTEREVFYPLCDRCGRNMCDLNSSEQDDDIVVRQQIGMGIYYCVERWEHPEEIRGEPRVSEFDGQSVHLCCKCGDDFKKWVAFRR